MILLHLVEVAIGALSTFCGPVACCSEQDVMVNADTEHHVMDNGNTKCDGDHTECHVMDNRNTEHDGDHVYALKSNEVERKDDMTVEVSSEVERKDDVTVEVMNEQKVIDIKPDDSGQLSDEVNLSGNVVYNASTGEVFNIDDIDISQFMEIYLVDTAVPGSTNQEKNYIVEATVPEVMNQETNYILKAVMESDDEEIKVKKEEQEIKDAVNVHEVTKGYEKDGSEITEKDPVQNDDKICDVQEEHAEKEIVKVCDIEQHEDKEEVHSDKSVQGGDGKNNVKVRDITQPEEEQEVDSDESVQGGDGKNNVKVHDITQPEEKQEVDSDESVKVIEIIQCEDEDQKHVYSVKRVAGDVIQSENTDKESVCKENVDSDESIVGDE